MRYWSLWVVTPFILALFALLRDVPAGVVAALLHLAIGVFATTLTQGFEPTQT